MQLDCYDFGNVGGAAETAHINKGKKTAYQIRLHARDGESNYSALMN